MNPEAQISTDEMERIKPPDGRWVIYSSKKPPK